MDSLTGIPIGYIQLNRHETSDKTFSDAFLHQTIGATTAQDVEREIIDRKI